MASYKPGLTQILRGVRPLHADNAPPPVRLVCARFDGGRMFGLAQQTVRSLGVDWDGLASLRV
jgi:hypothetical protein